MIDDLFPKVSLNTLVPADEKGHAEASSARTWLNNNFPKINGGALLTGTVDDIDLLDNLIYEGLELDGAFFHHAAFAWADVMRSELDLKWYTSPAIKYELLFIGDIALRGFIVSPEHCVWAEDLKADSSFYHLTQQFLIVAGLQCRRIAEKPNYRKLAKLFCVHSLALLKEFAAE